MKGIVISSRYGNYQVNCDGVIYNVVARGLVKVKSQILVGDQVEIDSSFVAINKVFDRKNQLKRPLIANIDQLFIVQSIKEPDFSFLLIYKYLTYARINSIKPIIIITQIDKDKDCSLINEIKNEFERMGIDLYFVSSKTHEGIENIIPLFKDKITCLLGQTGVGKSSLINAIEPNFEREVGEYSTFLHRGKHKTKEVLLLPFEDGYIADTPGFSSLDLELSKRELAQYYAPFGDSPLTCFYSNCLHISEKNCAVKEKLNGGDISKTAYDCYIKLLEEAKDN